MSPCRPTRVAIIGAGLAGLACADALQRVGLRVTVYESADTVGGRLHTCTGQGWQCDDGAQYFTARDPGFAAVVDAWIAAGIAARWPARVASWDGATLRHSQRALARFVGTPTMDAPARALAAGLEVRTRTSVHAIERSSAGWVVNLGAATAAATQMVDAVLLAVPAPDAARLLAERAPALLRVARSAQMLPAWAVVLRFAAPIDPGYDALFVNAGPVRWVARDSSKPARAGAETWLLHATATWSQVHGDATPAQVIASLLPELAALGLPPPLACDAYRWVAASTDPPLQAGSVWDASLGLGLCGDWLAGGKVEGAWRSGTALAREVAGVTVTGVKPQ
ncbi:FAD-dependent oxidoreductase [Xanthomonas cucurbitae]|uniref:FAD-dependent oxidoreductase n=2 Tax=Xanthomonas TaxID=338 RepID=A0A2S7DWV3_9XANT|nr:NAD/FAD-dependent oxidoreductase [Xanthomonas cucurbitae]QHG89003.1 FAD-binding protein [Xanthomonas cucurbitae]WDM69683.1 FAD-dependent oxidoreductase [Xanthomonas cucurbitae]WDM73558.1 FAD-dependent oxidoreductase [Xanthomonas cucurbitae]WDM77277.1 FAD-dependent oxidoreductase [Xanthomonas cucurbitae]